MRIVAKRRDGTAWQSAITFFARSRETAFRTAARKLGIRGPVLTSERVGSDQWLVNVDGVPMMVLVYQR